MDIYADLPSAKPSSDATASSSSGKAAPTASASKGSWAHSKFQGMIANRRTVKAVSLFVRLLKIVGGSVFATQQPFVVSDETPSNLVEVQREAAEFTLSASKPERVGERAVRQQAASTHREQRAWNAEQPTLICTSRRPSIMQAERRKSHPKILG